jgi:23S rRNA pseudouridine2605 synthase
LILTNDWEFAHRIIHPSSSFEKEYLVSIGGAPSDSQIDELRTGVLLGGRMTKPCEVEVTERDLHRTMVRIILHEGRKRQIRRMLGAIGFSVVDLKRVRIGPITLSGLKEGRFRPLTEKEVRDLRYASSAKIVK